MALPMRNILMRVSAKNQVLKSSVAMMGDSGAGSGAGKGGGSGGSIRDAGGSFGKREAAQENQYFRKQQEEQLAKLRKHVDSEVERHQKMIADHEKAIKEAKKHLAELEKDGK